MKDKSGMYYHPKKNRLEIFQLEKFMGAWDYAWWEKGFGWSKSKKGRPSEHGWVFIAEGKYFLRDR